MRIYKAQQQSYTIPNDLVEEILSRLPVKSLMRFKCISKAWHTLISSHQFAKSHFQRASQNPNLLMLIFMVFHCGVKNMLRQTWLLAMACYVLNYIMCTYVHPNIWFGTRLPKVTRTYQVQHQHLIHFLVGFAVLALAAIIPLMITRY